MVEDERRLAAALKRGLEIGGLAVDVVGNGNDAVWAATEVSYDVIILDIMLPGLNGYRVCSTLRDRGNWTPILMLTAKDGELDEAEALDTGADDFLTKPFSLVVLEARIRALVRRGATARPTVIRVGDIDIDPAARTVHRQGHLIELTSKEYAIVAFLARRRDEVVSRADLIMHAWDYTFDGDPNIIEVHMSNLRRKLDRPFDTARLTTIRGAGYRLDSGET